MKSLNLFFLVFLFELLICDIPFAAVEPPKNPNSAKSCAICHYRWIDTFFVEGRGSDLVDYQSEKVAGDPEMCFSCHDGSIMDSRERVHHGKGHKTDTPPPSNMEIPKIFPLDDKGNMQCSTCHTAHGVESGTDTGETIFLRTSNRDSATCRMCHTDKEKSEGVNHHLGTSKRIIPANLKMLGAIEGGEENQVICETCHTAHGSLQEGLLIKGAGDCGLCLECHPEKGVFTVEGERKPFHVINVRPKTLTIPKELMNGGAKLGYNGVITCQTCHKVHNNKTNERFLLIKKDLKSGLCLTCHKSKQDIVNTKHNLSLSAPAERNLEGKTVSEGGICSSCHLPHKAARKPFKEYRETDYTTQFCLSCHSEGNVAEKTKLTGYTHPLNIQIFEKKTGDTANYASHFEKGELSLPLFNQFGIEDKDGKMTCLTCHDTHRVPTHSEKRGGKKDSSEENTGLFLRRPSHEICRECHNEKFSVADSKHDLNKVFPHKEEILKWNISDSGLCGNCHQVHNSQQEGFLWAREITAKTGNVVQELCISCHNEKGMASEIVIQDYSHPVNIFPLDKGISTTLPLFDAYGKRKDNGVMTCYTCHDPHRWTQVQSVSDDSLDITAKPRNSFLRIEQAPSFKLCLNCHDDKAAVENTDHNLIITSPDSKNTVGRKPLESGVCGVCHLMHNSKNRIMLWARDLGAGENIMERMCESCHADNGPAENKIPQISSHPKTPFISIGKNMGGRILDFPLFDETTGEPVTVGNISCPSCHDAHRWSGKPFVKHEGINVEGDVTTSFLREQIHNLVCKDCHGFDALFRFKYFHEGSKRLK